jgi:hypothetical protein
VQIEVLVVHSVLRLVTASNPIWSWVVDDVTRPLDYQSTLIYEHVYTQTNILTEITLLKDLWGRKKIFGGRKKIFELPANVTVLGLDLKKAHVTVSG